MQQPRTTFNEQHPIAGVGIAFLATLVIGAGIGLGVGNLSAQAVTAALDHFSATR